MLALFDLRNAPMGAKAHIFSDPLLFRTWPLIRAFGKLKSQVREVQPRVSEIILYWVCDHFYQMFTKCGTHFPCILATFLNIFCHCGSYLNYIFEEQFITLGPFATLWRGLGGPRAKRLPKSLILGSPWASFGLPFSWKFLAFCNEKICRICGWSSHAFWIRRWCQMAATM